MSIKYLIEHVLYPAMEHKKGNHVRAYLAEMKTTQYLKEEELQKLRRERLCRLLLTCIHDVPAYQSLQITEEEVQKDPFQVLQQIPILSKRNFQQHPEQYRNQQYDPKQLIANSTGGSTGEPLKFYMDRYDVEHFEAARWRGLSWYGITPGSRSVMLWGNPIELSQNEQKSARRKERFLKNRTILSAYALTPEKVASYIPFLNRYQPEYIYGYATALYTFAQLLQPIRDQLHLKKLKVVVSTSETLYEHQRTAIQAVFGCPVANEYGARDAGILAYSCPHGHLHMTAENVIMEVVDPVTHQPVSPGESGVVVTTDLNNLAMPRLRYLLGDTATLSQEKACACGVTLPMIASLDGREDAIFKLPDGTLMHGHFVYHLAGQYDSVAQFQLIQTDLAHAELKLVMKKPCEEDANRFLSDLQRFMPGVCITCTKVDQIEPSKSGKIRYAIRRFPL